MSNSQSIRGDSDVFVNYSRQPWWGIFERDKSISVNSGCKLQRCELIWKVLFYIYIYIYIFFFYTLHYPFREIWAALQVHAVSFCAYTHKVGHSSNESAQHFVLGKTLTKLKWSCYFIKFIDVKWIKVCMCVSNLLFILSFVFRSAWQGAITF